LGGGGLAATELCDPTVPGGFVFLEGSTTWPHIRVSVWVCSCHALCPYPTSSCIFPEGSTTLPHLRASVLRSQCTLTVAFFVFVTGEGRAVIVERTPRCLEAPRRSLVVQLMRLLEPELRAIAEELSPACGAIVDVQTVEHALCECRKWWGACSGEVVPDCKAYRPSCLAEYRQMWAEFVRAFRGR
jgi:hypothetical protein